MKSKPRFWFWKLLAKIALGTALLLGLFVVAFVFNPFEEGLRDLRDVVPREVDFYLRKQSLELDFTGRAGRLQFETGRLPEPVFWAELGNAAAWREVERGPAFQGLQRDLRPHLQQAVDGLASVQQSSGGFLDLARDLLGKELIVAGYFEDRSKQPPQPLQQPWWCVYARVSWRLRAAHGLLGWSMVRDQARQQGVEMTVDGELIAVRTPQTPGTIWVGRRKDCLMVGNDRGLLQQSLRLADGVEGEQPLGLAAHYAEGVTDPLRRWSQSNLLEEPTHAEFSVATTAIDGFRRFASAWPDGKNRDSMNERVLATFLNLKGWNSVTGSMVFEPGKLSLLGRVVLNSNLHTPFQSTFYRAEKQRRQDWLMPFLRMVPDSACAAAALRMPPGDFLHAMCDALLPEERQLLDDVLRRCTFQNQPLADARDLVERIKLMLLPRTGFVFRKNVPDLSINKQTGALFVPVDVRSPVPQVAWVFWLSGAGSKKGADEVVELLRRHASVFGFQPPAGNVYHLPVDGLPEPVTEFANRRIPGTGELAMIVFSDFLVVSNSGPLIKDMLRTRYRFGSLRPILDDEQWNDVERELPQELNAFIWMRGSKLLAVLDDYRAASVQQGQAMDPEWAAERRSSAEEAVRRQRYPQYPSLASMPRALVDGEFNTAVRAELEEMWKAASAGFSAQDLPIIDQLRGAARLLDAGYLQLELENNYIRFQGKAVGNFAR